MENSKILKTINLDNYKTLDLIFQEGNNYTLIYYSCIDDSDNSDYLNRFTIAEKEFKEENLPKIKNLISEEILTKKVHYLHPFSRINLFCYSINELKNYSDDSMDVNYIDSVNQEILDLFEDSKLCVNSNDSFAFLKAHHLKLLTVMKSDYSRSEIIKKRDSLQYIKTIKSTNDRFDDNATLKVKSFLNDMDDSLTSAFNFSKKQFKEEILRTDNEFAYFDKVINSIYSDYIKFLIKLSDEKGYFIPATKLYRSHYISLFRHILEEYCFYLTDEIKEKL